MWQSADFKEDPIDLARGFVRLVRVYAGGQLALNTPWTLAVKKALTELASDCERKYNHNGERIDCLCTDSHRGVSEFMLDVVWWWKGKEGRRQYCALAVEAEWGDGSPYDKAVERDFEKLLSFKAPIKMMVISSWNESTYLAAHKAIRDCIECYGRHEEGEVYLIVDFRPKPFNYEIHSLTIRKDGSLDTALFSRDRHVS